MISLLNPDTNIVINPVVKKPVSNVGQSYLFPTAQVTENTYELGIASISLASSKKNQSNSNNGIIPVAKPIHTAQNVQAMSSSLKKPTFSKEIVFPQKDWICMLYLMFALFLATCTIVANYYTTQVAIMLCPLFTYTVIVHSFIGNSNSVITYTGLLVICCYPFTLVFSNAYILVTLFVLFIFFCLLRVFQDKYTAIQISLFSMILMCAIIAIVVYAVYPKTVYGAHAAFLCLCVMACFSVYLTERGTYKLKFYPFATVTQSDHSSNNASSKTLSSFLRS